MFINCKNRSMLFSLLFISLLVLSVSFSPVYANACKDECAKSNITAGAPALAQQADRQVLEKWLNVRLELEQKMSCLASDIVLDLKTSDDKLVVDLYNLCYEYLEREPNPYWNYFLAVDYDASKSSYVMTIKFDNPKGKAYKDYYIFDHLSAVASQPAYAEYVRVNQEMNQWIATNIQPTMTDYQKEKVIFDYLVTNFAYDTELKVHKAVEMWQLKKGVCEGYSDLFYILAKKAGLNVGIVWGNAKQIHPQQVAHSLVVQSNQNSTNKASNHSWNWIKLGDKYYHIDPTWGKAITLPNCKLVSYEYFNLNDATLKLVSERAWANYFPVCDTEDFNYYKINQLEANTINDLATIINRDTSPYHQVKWCSKTMSFDQAFAAVNGMLANHKKLQDTYFIVSKGQNVYLLVEKN